jgi:hypothetical protein
MSTMDIIPCEWCGAFVDTRSRAYHTAWHRSLDAQRRYLLAIAEPDSDPSERVRFLEAMQ